MHKRNDTTIVAIISTCNGPTLHRLRYVEALRQHIAIDAFGYCFQRPITITDMPAFLRPYKFYLSLERVLCSDFATDRLWHALTAGVVPIVLYAAKCLFVYFSPLYFYLIENKKFFFFFSFETVVRPTGVSFPLRVRR